MSHHAIFAINMTLFVLSTLIYLEKRLLNLSAIYKQQALLSSALVNLNVFQNWQSIAHFNMHFIYFAFFVFQLGNIQTTEAQTEQTDLLDLLVQKVSEERNVSISLPMQG
ncbi:hypothetical protein LOAG_19062, partial [Loa loa]